MVKWQETAEHPDHVRDDYIALYNHQLPQSPLKSETPMRAMKDWYASNPHLFVKRPYDHPGCDTKPWSYPKVFTLVLHYLGGHYRGGEKVVELMNEYLQQRCFNARLRTRKLEVGSETEPGIQKVK